MRANVWILSVIMAVSVCAENAARLGAEILTTHRPVELSVPGSLRAQCSLQCETNRNTVWIETSIVVTNLTRTNQFFTLSVSLLDAQGTPVSGLQHFNFPFFPIKPEDAHHGGARIPLPLQELPKVKTVTVNLFSLLPD